jgi:hypothetical protein
MKHKKSETLLGAIEGAKPRWFIPVDAVPVF